MAVSPYYPTDRENKIKEQCNAKVQSIQQQYNDQSQSIQQQCDNQVQAIEQQCSIRLQQYKDQVESEVKTRTKEMNETRNALSLTKDQLSQLQHEIKQKDGTISQLNNEVSRLQSKIGDIEQSKTVAQIVDSIRDPIAELAGILKHTTGDNEKKQKASQKIKTPKINKRMIIGGIGGCVLILLIIFVVLPKNVCENADSNANTDSSETVNQTPQGNPNDSGKPTRIVTQPDSAQFDIKNVKIDIKEYNGTGNLELTKTYTVTVNNGANENGRWSGEGCQITPTNDPNKVKLKPTMEKVTIIYSVGTQATTRSLDVNK